MVRELSALSHDGLERRGSGGFGDRRESYERGVPSGFGLGLGAACEELEVAAEQTGDTQSRSVVAGRVGFVDGLEGML